MRPADQPVRKPIAARVTGLSPWVRYGIAVASVGLAVVLRAGFDPLWGGRQPLLTFYPAIMVSAWIGGLGPGVVATLLSAAAAVHLWMPRVFSPALEDPGGFVALMLFIGIGVVISGLNAAWRRGSIMVAQAAEQFRMTLASIGDAVITTDHEGRVTLLNPVAEALTGWSTAEAAGRPVTDIFVILDEETRRAAENPTARVLRDGVITGLANHTVLAGRHGREIPIDDSAAPIRMADGRVAGAIIVFRDITERKRAERRQAVQHAATRVLAEAATLERAAPELLRLIAEGLGWDVAVLWTIDPDTKALRCADVWHRPGANVEGFVAGTRTQTFPRGVGLPGCVWTTAEPVWLTDATESGEFVRGLEAAAESVHGAVFVPIAARDEVTGVVEVLSQQVQPRDPDVLVILSSVANRIGQFLERRRVDLERAELLASEQQAREDAEGANRAKDEFLAMLSHELRTPLSTIVGWSRMLHAGHLPPDQMSQAVASIERNAQLQARLVEDLLDVSRIVSGKLAIHTERVDLPAVAEAALEMFRSAADGAGVHLTLAVDDPLPAVIGDPARLHQVIANLVSNAVKFTERGGTVQVTARRAGSSVEVAVTDSGRGIRPEFLPYVFDRFTQDQQAGRHGSRGLGIGLTIVWHLVQRHGGTVQAVSAGEGRGATFTVRLPAASAAGGVQGARVVARGQGRAVRPVTARLDGVRILVVDDDDDTTALLHAVFSAVHAEVSSACSAEDAREVLARHPVDVVISDISLPGDDGYALIRHIRAIRSPRPVVAIALTARAAGEDRERTLAAGFDAYVAKPADPAAIAALVADLRATR